MGKADVYESDYLENEEVFADLVNGVLYQGEQVVKPCELEEQDGELRSILGEDYRLNLFDYHDYDDFDRFHSELQSVFEFLRYAGDKESMKIRLEQHRERYENLSSQAKVLLTKLANIRKIPGVGEKEFEKGDFSMCKAFEDMRKEGFIEGEKKGEIKGEVKGRAKEIIETGYEFKLSREDTLRRLQDKLNISLEKAQEYVRIYDEQMI